MTKTTITVTAKTWDEKRVEEVDDAHAVALATFTTDWNGEIAGTSTCRLLITYTEGDPSKPETLKGSYAGCDLVTATVDGRSGTFVLAVSGQHGDGVARTDVRVVEGSGTGDLRGISGTGSYAASAMEYPLELDYSL